MKKIILATLFLISGKCFAQTTVDTFSFKQPLKFTQLNAKSGEVSLPDATTTTAGAMTAAQVQQVNTVTADVNKVKTDLTALTNTVNNLPTVGGSSHKSKTINTSTYTLLSSDNNSTLFVSTGCNILLTTLPAGFKCTVIRTGGQRPRFSWSGIAVNLRANYTPLASQYLGVDITFETSTNCVIK